jgi:hypothetical protein
MDITHSRQSSLPRAGSATSSLLQIAAAEATAWHIQSEQHKVGPTQGPTLHGPNGYKVQERHPNTSDRQRLPHSKGVRGMLPVVQQVVQALDLVRLHPSISRHRCGTGERTFDSSASMLSRRCSASACRLCMLDAGSSFLYASESSTKILCHNVSPPATSRGQTHALWDAKSSSSSLSARLSMACGGRLSLPASRHVGVSCWQILQVQASCDLGRLRRISSARRSSGSIVRR